MAVNIRVHLDLKGTSAPVPVDEIAGLMSGMAPGELIEVVSTDPWAVRDFDAWARSTGNDLLESSQFGNVFRFVLRKR